MGPWSRDDIIASRGFCSYHSHRILRFAEARFQKLGLSLALQSLIDDRLIALKNLSQDSQALTNGWTQADIRSTLQSKLLGKNPKPLRGLARKIFATFTYVEARRPACSRLSESNAIHVQIFVQMVVESEMFNDIPRESRSLCLPHFVEVAQTASRRLRERTQQTLHLGLESNGCSRKAVAPFSTSEKSQQETTKRPSSLKELTQYR